MKFISALRRVFERGRAEPARARPLLIDDRTYDTTHPDYDASLVRNEPGRIINSMEACRNVVFEHLRGLGDGDWVPAAAWDRIRQEALEEVTAAGEHARLLERKAIVEAYAVAAGNAHRATYQPGWVNLDDALFLYWLVRRLKPATIVETGVSNGLSSAFITLALARNGGPGQLHAIDLPQIFDAGDPRWTVAGKIYGVMIPHDRACGWLVPESCRDRFHLREGDATILLPALIEELDSVDMFFHDSDHTSRHMMFEFGQGRRKLRPGGVIVADNVSWNAALWECADQWGVPAYNYGGSVGVVFC